MELDKDLLARQEARMLCRQASQAQKILGRMEQKELDTIVEEVACAFEKQAKNLAEQAVAETGFGNAEDKAEKNRFASRQVAQSIRKMKTVGVLKKDAQAKLWEVGVPVGVIAAIVPSTNPTSTVCYKALIALKSGNSIVFSPHPKALGCTLAAIKIVEEAAERAGAPRGSVACLTVPALAGCQELMGAPETRLILATGGPGMVKAAYSSGRPAIGVGAGNGPAYIHPSADVGAAIRCIAKSKTFDYGTVCASEQSIMVQRQTEQAVVAEAKKQGFYFMDDSQAKALAELLFKPNGGLNPAVVGKSAQVLAQMAGFCVPDGTGVLVARETGVGEKYPYSMEKLCPVLAFYVLENEEEVLKKAMEVLHHEGSGHTFSMHAGDEKAVERFAKEIPVSRFLVNAPAAQGGIGAATPLQPALTLGCGAVGGSSSSNNIGPMDLINIRRVAWGQEKQDRNTVDPDLVEILTARILERLK